MAAPGDKSRQRFLHERQRREHVHLVDARKRRQRIGGERRLRARPEQARIVDEQVDPVTRRLDERTTVLGIGDVARDRVDALEVGGGAPERIGSARIDDEPPSTFDERAYESEAEPA